MPRFCLEFDAADHQRMKVAAAFEGFDSLKAWATNHLIAQAKQTVSSRITEFPSDGVIPPGVTVFLPQGTTATQIPNPPKDPEKGEGGAT